MSFNFAQSVSCVTLNTFRVTKITQKQLLVMCLFVIYWPAWGGPLYISSRSPHRILSILKQKPSWRYLLSGFCSPALLSPSKWQPRGRFLSEMNSWIHASAHCGEESNVQDNEQTPGSTQESHWISVQINQNCWSSSWEGLSRKTYQDWA